VKDGQIFALAKTVDGTINRYGRAYAARGLDSPAIRSSYGRLNVGNAIGKEVKMYFCISRGGTA